MKFQYVNSQGGDVMGKIKSLKRQVEKLSPDELAAFRRWYAAFDAKAWGRQFEADVKGGRLMLWLRMHFALTLLVEGNIFDFPTGLHFAF